MEPEPFRCSLPAQSLGTSVTAAGPAFPPPRIPDHSLIHPIGEGSYGTVWLSVNLMGTRRAVKVVYRRSFSDPKPFDREFNGIRRFEPISRSHDGFVDILQVGSDEKAGCFYYVMELADEAEAADSVGNGEAQVPTSETARPAPPDLPLSATSTAKHAGNHYLPKTLRTEIERRGRLPVQDCIAIGSSLASALEHLHSSGLVHRDIKPSNIIFVNGQPKLADIGLVARLDEAHSLVGTQGFMPPEGPGTPQADVYSLGKVLYEICSGKDRHAFPEPPTQLAQLPDRSDLLELNEVVNRACDSNPNRRYQSARDMHQDLLLLQAGKSVKRLRIVERRLSVVTRIAVIAAVALAIGLPGLFIALHQSHVARQEANKSRQIAQVLEEMLQGVEPSVALGKDTTLLREILDRSAERVGTTLSSQPEVEAELKDIIAQAYAEIGHYAKAEAMHRQVLALRTNLFGYQHLAVAESLDHLGAVLQRLGRFAEAEATIREGLALRSKLGGKEDPALALSMNHLAMTLTEEANNREAEVAARAAVAILRGNPDKDHAADLAAGLGTLASVLARGFKFGDAETLQREALEISARLRGEEHVATERRNLAYILEWRGKLDGAESEYRHALAMLRSDAGDTHPAVNSVLFVLAAVLLREGKSSEAEEAIAQVLTPALQGRPESAGLLRTRAICFTSLGRWKDAAADLATAIQYDPANIGFYLDLVPLLAACGDLEGFRDYRREALERFSSTREPRLADGLVRSCLLLPCDETQSAALERLADLAISEGRTFNYYASFEFTKGLVDYRRGRFASAADWMSRSLSNLDFVQPAQIYPALAMAHYRLGQTNQARLDLAQAFEAMETDLPSLESANLMTVSRDWLIAKVLFKEATALLPGSGEPGGIEQLLNDSITEAGAGAPEFPGLLRARAEFFARHGRSAEAVADLRSLLEREPTNHMCFHLLAPLLVATGNLEGYRSNCHEALKRFGHLKDPRVLRLLAQDCLILPNSGPELQEAGELARTALDTGSGGEPWNSAWLQSTRALAAYRQGDFRSAADWAQKSLGYGSARQRYLRNCLILAMAWRQLRDFERARTALAEARQVPKMKLPSLGYGDSQGYGEWMDVLINDSLLKEAEAMLEGAGK